MSNIFLVFVVVQNIPQGTAEAEEEETETDFHDPIDVEDEDDEDEEDEIEHAAVGNLQSAQLETSIQGSQTIVQQNLRSNCCIET